MPRRLVVAFALASGLLGLTSLVSAQSLADVARKEVERRKTITNPSKVYTNADLHPAPRPTASAPDVKDDAKKDDTKDDQKKEPEKPAAPAKEAVKEPVKDKAYWTDRFKTLQEQLARDQTYADALQSRINALTTDFVNRDDPAQKRVIEQTRLTAIAELDRLKQRIPEDKKAIDDFLEEARRAGVPPGWLR